MTPRGAIRAALFALVGVGAATPIAAQQWYDFRAGRQVQGLERLDVELLYAAGRLTVTEAPTSLLYDARLHYDADRLVPQRDWVREGDRGQLRLAVSSVADAGDEGRARIRIEDWDLEFDLEDLPRDGLDEATELALFLHPMVPIGLKLGVGAGRARLDLGGMTLNSLELRTGASDARLTFDRVNRSRMDLLSIKSGAAEFVAEHLGNARFERLEFHGFVGDVLLDFSGEWSDDSEAEIKMALGELVMRVPSDIGVRIHRSGLAAVTAEDFEKVGDAYVTPNWTSAPVHLEITLTAGLGKVTVERG